MLKRAWIGPTLLKIIFQFMNKFSAESENRAQNIHRMFSLEVENYTWRNSFNPLSELYHLSWFLVEIFSWVEK